MNGREFNIVGKEIILIQMHRKTKAIDCGNLIFKCNDEKNTRCGI